MPWVSGFTQAVGAQALARAGSLLSDPLLLWAADASFRALRGPLLMPIGGGSWVREYGFTSEVILNAQLQSLLSLESYARIAGTSGARRLAAELYTASRTLLPRFSLGSWSRYSLGGNAATPSYHTYHLDLLRKLAAAHPGDGIWLGLYLDWSASL